jgi:ubiquinone/menaquinone biosynthesis C-methylase UbiE
LFRIDENAMPSHRLTYLSKILNEHWTRWQKFEDKQAHFNFQTNEAAPQYINSSVEGAHKLLNPYFDIIEKTHFSSALDFGCSVGGKCFSLRQKFPGIKVVGLDPDNLALQVGQAYADLMAASGEDNLPTFIAARGENLPFPDSAFDLITSVTVIEHVDDVEACIRETARVLAPGGYLILEAPNYLWPFEPHLRVFIPPLSTPKTIRFFSRLQGVNPPTTLVNGLKCVTPHRIERMFKRYNLEYQNVVRNKLRTVLNQDFNTVSRYKRASRFLSSISKVVPKTIIERAAIGLGAYPSLTYLCRKPLAQTK